MPCQFGPRTRGSEPKVRPKALITKLFGAMPAERRCADQQMANAVRREIVGPALPLWTIRAQPIAGLLCGDMLARILGAVRKRPSTCSCK